LPYAAAGRRHREPQLTTHLRAQIWNWARQPEPEQFRSALRHWDMQESVQVLLLPSASL
jgi:hypothetical protein